MDRLSPATGEVLGPRPTAHRRRGRPILLTTNKPLAALGDVVHDGDLAEAILDRLLERGVHFALRGRSYRTRHLSEEDAPPKRAKAS